MGRNMTNAELAAKLREWLEHSKATSVEHTMVPNGFVEHIAAALEADTWRYGVEDDRGVAYVEPGQIVEFIDDQQCLRLFTLPALQPPPEKDVT